jgi:hypothetical protein
VTQGLADVFLHPTFFDPTRGFSLIDVAISIATGTYTRQANNNDGGGTGGGAGAVDPSVQKTVFQFLSLLIKTILESSSQCLASNQRDVFKSFSVYATETLTRAALFCIFSPSLDDRDAQCQQMIGEAVQLLSTVLVQCPLLYFEGRNVPQGEEKGHMLALLRHLLVVEINLPPQASEQFLEKLGATNANGGLVAPKGGEAKALLSQLIRSRKGK